jgi:hypothetical protein
VIGSNTFNLSEPLMRRAASGVKLPLEEARYWAEHAPHSRLEIIDSASQALAFAKAGICASITREFLGQLAK